MRLLLAIFILSQCISRVMAGGLPLTNKEIDLMLRSGYSNDAVLRELSTRHFAGDFDEVAEQQLVRRGGNESLISALRSRIYASSPAESAAVQEKLAAREKPSTSGANQSTQLETPPPTATSSTTPTSDSPDAIYRFLQHDLVSLQGGELKPLDDKAIVEKKLYLLFFSSISSAPARKFTTPLVEYYNRMAPLHPEFETIFFSQDRSAFGMETNMRQANMPWPAVVFDRVAIKAPIQKNVLGLPLLILVTRSGRILYSSSGIQNADADKVMADLDQILATSSADPLAPPPRSLTNAQDYFRTQVQ